MGLAPLSELTDENIGLPILSDWIRGNLNSDGALMQVIISREQRMIGISYKANWVDNVWTPTLVSPFNTFWSYRYDFAATSMPWLYDFETLFYNLFIVSWIFSTLHELDELNQHAGSKASFLAFVGHPFYILINFPSIVSPVLLEMFKSSLAVTDFVLWTGVNTMIFLVRFFQEGVVVGPFRRMVGTLALAAPQLFSFAIAVGVTMFVVSEVENNLFAVYTSLYSSQFLALISIFDSFANGKSFSGSSSSTTNGGTSAYEASPAGYLLMYLVSALVLFLIFSQFFIAILVNAFDSATTKEAEEDALFAKPHGFTERKVFASLYKNIAFKVRAYRRAHTHTSKRTRYARTHIITRTHHHTRTSSHARTQLC